MVLLCVYARACTTLVYIILCRDLILVVLNTLYCWRFKSIRNGIFFGVTFIYCVQNVQLLLYDPPIVIPALKRRFHFHVTETNFHKRKPIAICTYNVPAVQYLR